MVDYYKTILEYSPADYLIETTTSILYVREQATRSAILAAEDKLWTATSMREQATHTERYCWSGFKVRVY
jgi:hypothetical protein